MRSLNYNRQINIQERTVTYDSYNEPIETWADGTNYWATVLTTGGGEFYAAQKINATTQMVFKVRYTASISVINRVKYDGRIFEILSVTDTNGTRTELSISAKEVV